MITLIVSDMSERKVADEIVALARQNSDITKKKLITKNELIQIVAKRVGVGSSTVRDILSQLKILGVVGYQVVQKAHVYFVIEKNIGEISKIGK
jgi:hypothetical protein